MNGFGKILDGWHCRWMSFCLPAGGYASAQSLKNARLVLVEPPGIPVNGVRHARIMIPIMADVLRLPVLTNAVSRDQQDQRVSTLIPWRTNRSKYELLTFIF
jgi:hypothetical protein